MAGEKIRILHLADIHLGAVNRFLPEDRRDDWQNQIWDSFREVIQYAISPNNPVHLILISGDLFDSPNPEEKWVMRVKSLFRKAADQQIPIFLVPGNHDNIISPDSVYRREKFPGVILLDSPNITEPYELEFDGHKLHIYGMAYSFLSQPPFDAFAPRDAGATNLAMLHGSLLHSAEWTTHSRDVPLDPENLFKTGFDYIALGHYHNFQHYQKNGTHLVYPGSLEPLNWGEEGIRHLVVLEIQRKRLVVTSLAAFYQRRTYHNIQLDISDHNFQSSDDIADYLIEKFASKQALLRLTLRGHCSFSPDVERILAACQDHFYYLTLIDDTRVYLPEALTVLKEEKTIRGLVLQKLLKRADTAAGEREKQVAEKALKILLGYFSGDAYKG